MHKVAGDSTVLPRPFSRSAIRMSMIVTVVLATLVAAFGVWIGWYFQARDEAHGDSLPARADTADDSAGPVAASLTDDDLTVRLTEDQERAIGLRTALVKTSDVHDVSFAPGQIAPNELQYAYITPRAAGVVRSVTAQVGQDVKAGDLLATIDSPEVGRARLELYTMLQSLEVARAQADWEVTIYNNTRDLLERIHRGETPDHIHTAFKDRALGENRERMMTAYAQYRLAVATIERNRELHAQQLITTKQFEKVNADFEVAQATYQSLMDQMGYQARLANTRAHQALKQAETSVRAARERLRILGVKPDGTEPEVAAGKVLGVKPDGTLPASSQEDPTAERPEKILPDGAEQNVAVKPVGAGPDQPAKPKEAPVSTYSIWAPFDGTILEREMIVPGVAVDTTHRIFTMANLASVWVEVSVHESHFNLLARSRGGQIRFHTAAYPGQEFDGDVIYSGDVVDEKSRTVKLLARAQNPGRLLKPGMFVDVQVFSPRTQPAALVPTAAVLTQGSRSFVYVRTGPATFRRRDIEVETRPGDTAVVRAGLQPGEEVVVEGSSKLKSLTIQLVSAERQD